MTLTNNKKPLIVIGTSAGGIKALKQVLAPIPSDFNAPILVVQHMASNADGSCIKVLSQSCQLKVQFALNGFSAEKGYVYLAPPDYHFRLDADATMMISSDEKIRFSRPSIDALFESVSCLSDYTVIAVVLTGANADGAKGAKAISKNGGTVIIESPESAEVAIMPQATKDACRVDYSLKSNQIGALLWDLVQ